MLGRWGRTFSSKLPRTMSNSPDFPRRPFLYAHLCVYNKSTMPMESKHIAQALIHVHRKTSRDSELDHFGSIGVVALLHRLYSRVSTSVPHNSFFFLKKVTNCLTIEDYVLLNHHVCSDIFTLVWKSFWKGFQFNFQEIYIQYINDFTPYNPRFRALLFIRFRLFTESTKLATRTINQTVDYMARGLMSFMRGVDITPAIGRVGLKVEPFLGPEIAQ